MIDTRYSTMRREDLSIQYQADGFVSAILEVPAAPTAVLVLAHGAGAGMNHAFMADIAAQLHGLGIATLRYQFPFMEHGSGRPDKPDVAHAAVRAAVAAAARALPGLSLFAGGKSFGGRMTSQAQALDPLGPVRGLAFIGFPLHPAGKPGVTRAAHLHDVEVPMLFLQGTRDALAELDLMMPMVESLRNAEVEVIDDGDHAFHVRRSSGRTDRDVVRQLAVAIRDWMVRLPPRPASLPDA